MDTKSGSQFWANVMVFFHIIIDNLMEFLLSWYWGPKKVCTKAPNKEEDAIVCKSAIDLARLIRERKLKSYDVVKAYINRIQILNPQLNAIVDGPFLEALDEAIVIDTKLDNKEYTHEELDKKPFLGVPFTTKDSTAVANKLNTFGLLSRKSVRAEEDAECVRLMKESGAIIIATSNVPEVNRWIEARNLIIGQTNNPYDLRRTAGGSSGGEGVLVSACCTAFGLGTDIGGSIRIPAFNCGIFGHKPSSDVINMRGCTSRTGKEQNSMVTGGPMTRYACDLKAILQILIKPEAHDKLRLSEPVDLTRLRYFYVPDIRMKQCNPVTRISQTMMYQVRRHFQNLSGNDVKLAELPGLQHSGGLWRYWMTQEPSKFNQQLGNGSAKSPLVELFKKLTGQSEHTMAAIFALIDGLLPPEKEEKMREVTTMLRRTVKELLGNDGVLFFHSSPRTAPFHYYPLVQYMDFNYCSIFNVLHLPVTQVPLGLDSNGMPMGIQVVAGEMNDRLCLAVAEELERAFGGWIPPIHT